MIRILCCALLIVSTACKQQSEQAPQAIKILPKTSENYYSVKDAPAKAVVDFLHWYADYRSGIDLIPKTRQAYLNHISESGMTTPAFVKELEKYMAGNNSSETELDRTSMDVDPVFRYPDFEHEMELLDQAIVEDIKVNGNLAEVKFGFVTGVKLDAFLILQDRKWIIDSFDYGKTNYN